MTPKRVLIVDDSPTIRALLRNHLAQDPRLVVVGEACDPFDAREKIKALLPDVLTLDVEMPRMNGLEFLEKLMRLRPMPVVMISTETQKGSAAALEALSLGAVECIGKPSFDRLSDTFFNLPDLLVAAANARLRTGPRAQISPSATAFNWNGKYVLIGSSTGGVDALETFLSSYPRNCPPTLITQHMPEGFLASFARRLESKMQPHVALATEGAPLLPGNVYLAPGGEYHLAVAGGADRPKCRLLNTEKRNGHRPSVEVLFDSAVPMGKRCVGVMLTGMGKDGAEAMVRLRQAGARCLAQDEASSVVFGMPRAALELGAAEQAVPIGQMAGKVLGLCSGSGSGSGSSAMKFSSVRRA
ncbi:two-component system chemotaxis response regulator CheB [Rhodobacter aestuarii]|uniref:Protein-glutamate methylesterase/protein-glutamine glutaminase n=1 Tax=Rhodobacter aestuarii TaxID=453582 RepID=A0A1N7J9M9_9RHOB|nr:MULTISPECIES: chemotaxis response regulator protein-glutamate methylesterase [Rhodobacter]PTV97031.1 two-component system chemotaxis response regulator CheB [Rhodobacter aestuarii]SIS45977.1 two-component system, chemotaxis family, response regulator CheB [Rhodobacter aestuarii]SOB98328.1 two-component system chemotaxis response regulator CheB [Rhodobacter sp. JA431]